MIVKLNNQEIEEIRSANEKRIIRLADGTLAPSLGQGSWYMGEKKQDKNKEVQALKLGIELGMTLIDTAEMYGEGGAELVVGEAIKGIRDKVFLVSKVYPHNAGSKNIEEACERSLKRLGTDHLDLYLLHWRGSVPLQETIEGMEKLKRAGKILRWGVSNFDKDDMEELWSYRGGNECVTNQVLYHLGSRGIEFDLLPWQREHKIPTMAYCPIAKGGQLRKELLKNSIVKEIADAHHATAIQILLAWCMRAADVMAIPKAVQEEHVIENARAGSIHLSKEELEQLDAVFPRPRIKMPLDIL